MNELMNVCGGKEICTGSPLHVGSKHCAAILNHYSAVGLKSYEKKTLSFTRI
jgi:hypothetical protein